MRLILSLVLAAGLLQNPGPQIEERINRAVELARQQKNEEAYEEFRAILKEDPGNLRVSALLAGMELATGRVKESIARAEVLLESDPKNADLHELLGQAYMAARDWKKAEGEWRWLIAERPNSEQAHMQLGAVLLQSDRFESALLEVNRALEINPKRSDARSLRGNLRRTLAWPTQTASGKVLRKDWCGLAREAHSRQSPIAPTRMRSIPTPPNQYRPPKTQRPPRH